MLPGKSLIHIRNKKGQEPNPVAFQILSTPKKRSDH